MRPPNQMLPALLALLVGAGCQTGHETGGLSLEEAGEVVLAEVTDDDDGVLVFAYPERLDASDEVRPFSPDPELFPDGAIALEEPSWFFWIDDAPGSRFVHENRFALVGVDSGDLSIHEFEWWPLVNGEAPWSDDDAYWNEAGWVYASPGIHRPVHELSTDLGMPNPADTTCSGHGGKALVVNGWRDEETGGVDMGHDGVDMHNTFEAAGFSTTYHGPEGATEVDEKASANSVRDWIMAEGPKLKAGETLVVYLTGHGFTVDDPDSIVDGFALAGHVWSHDLAKWLEVVDPGVEIIVMVDACESGGFTDELGCVADLVLTATDDTHSAYGDLDFDDDPNPNDKGGEFTSGVCIGLWDIISTPAEVEAVTMRAEAAMEGFWERAFAEAFETSAEFDYPAQNGLSFPQLVHGQPDKVKPEPPVVEAPTCTETAVCEEPAMDDLAIFASILAGVDVDSAENEENSCGGAVEQPRGNTTDHSDGTQAQTAVEEVDTYYIGTFEGCYELEGFGTCDGEHPAPLPSADAPGSPTSPLSIADFSCGDGPSAKTLCAADPLDPAGDYAVVYNILGEDLSLDDSLYHYQYGFVFDSDGDPANNYVAGPQFPDDFFQHTDLWYVAAYQPGAGWSLEVTDARDGDFVSIASGARVVAVGNLLALIVPRSELSSPNPGYRITSFRHTGDWGANGEWSGDVVPTIDQPLSSL